MKGWCNAERGKLLGTSRLISQTSSSGANQLLIAIYFLSIKLYHPATCFLIRVRLEKGLGLELGNPREMQNSHSEAKDGDTPFSHLSFQP